MPDNDGDGDSSSFSESASLGTLPSGQSVGLASSICQLSNGENCDLEASLEGHGGDCSVDKDATLPPLGVKLTGYRLLFMMTIFSFGTIKGILTYMGQSIAPNTLDWVSGTFLAVVLYWIGLYEDRDSDKWRWFFQVDLSPAIGHCAKRVVGRLMWPLSFLGNALRIVLLSMWLVFLALARAISYFAKRVVGGFVWLLSYLDNPYSIVFLSLSLTALGGYIRARYFPHVPLGPVLAVHAGVSVVALLLGFAVSLLSREVRVLHRGWEYAMSFVDIYGPGAPGRYGCFAEMGTIVGLLCGIAFLLLPFFVALVYVSIHHH